MFSFILLFSFQLCNFEKKRRGVWLGWDVYDELTLYPGYKVEFTKVLCSSLRARYRFFYFYLRLFIIFSFVFGLNAGVGALN